MRLVCQFWGPRSRDRELTNKKTIKKTALFGLKIYYFVYNSETTWRAQLKFVHNVGACKWFVQTEFGGPGLVIKMLQAENGKKMDDFEPIYPGKYRF